MNKSKAIRILVRGAIITAGFSGLNLYAETTVVVTPSNMGSWSFLATDNTGTTCTTPVVQGCTGTGQMVTGPGTPPLGTGSANLQTAANNGDGASSIVDNELNGTLVSAITALSYSAYDTTNNGQQVAYLQLLISYPDPTATSGADSDILFYEPPYQTPGTGNPGCATQNQATAGTTWQNWNALGGCWWDNNGAAGPGNGAGASNTLDYILANEPNSTNTGTIDATTTATIMADPNGDGGLQLTVGYASPSDSFNGNVDAVTVNGTVYDFEPDAATPEPGTFYLLGGALVAVLLKYKRSAI